MDRFSDEVGFRSALLIGSLPESLSLVKIEPYRLSKLALLAGRSATARSFLYLVVFHGKPMRLHDSGALPGILENPGRDAMEAAGLDSAGTTSTKGPRLPPRT